MFFLVKYNFINLCVSLIYEAGQKDSQVHSYNENLQSTFLKMLKCNFAMFSIWQASTWQTGVYGYTLYTIHSSRLAIEARENPSLDWASLYIKIKCFEL